MKLAKAIRYDELKGKTVSGAGYDWNTMLIAFTDGTVLALSADECEVQYEQREIDLLSRRWRGSALGAGLIDHPEWQAAQDADESERIKRLEAEIASLKERGGK